MTAIAQLLERIETVAKAARQPRWPKGNPKGGQFRPKGGAGAQGKLFGGGGAAAGAKAALAAAREALNATTGGLPHPRTDDNGKPVTVHVPTQPSPASTWRNAKQAAVFVPGGKTPASLHDVALAPWKAPKSDAGWNKVSGQMKGAEPPLTVAYDHKGEPKRPGAGVIVAEPDGRVWIVEPTNHFGGYNHSFPKGGKEPGIKSLQANAIKEAWEESGLKVEITGILGDYEGDTSVARYYIARRTGGTPADVGWESQAVKLVPPGQLGKYLNRERDRQIADDFAAYAQAVTAQRITKIAQDLAKSVNQRRYPKGHPLGGQFMPKVGAKAGSKKPGAVAKPTAAKPAAVTAAQAIADTKAMLGAFEPTLLQGKNPDNSALKAANKKITAIAALANAGDVAGLHAIKPTEPGKGANPYQKGVWKTWNDAILHAGSTAASGAGTNAAPTPKGKLKPAGSQHMKLGDLQYHAPKPGGSNPGGIYKDADGTRWLVKGSKGNPDMAKNEVLAARLYNAAGGSAPEMRLVELGNEYGGGIGVASRMVDGKLTKPNSSALAKDLAQNDFATDAWLANWDAVGLGFDNIAITEKGDAMRIDPGGALLYRAQGSPKGAAFNKLATEWDSMRDPKINPQNAAVFGSMTSGQLAESAAKLALISDDTISKLVNDYGPGDAKGKAALADTLIARKAAIMNKGHALNPGVFNESLMNFGQQAKAPAPAPKAPAKPAAKPASNVDGDGLATYQVGASGVATPVPQPKASPTATSGGKPNYTTTTKAGLVQWTNYTKQLEDAVAAGNHEKAKNIADSVNATWGKTTTALGKKNLGLFNDYAESLGIVSGPKAFGMTSRNKVGTEYHGTAFQKATWLKHQSNVEAILQSGNTKAAKEYLDGVMAKPSKTSFDIANKPVFEAWAKAKLGTAGAGAAPAAAKAPAAGSVKKPIYSGTEAQQTKWNKQTAAVKEQIDAGNLRAAKAIISEARAGAEDSDNPATQQNLSLFMAHTSALMNQPKAAPKVPYTPPPGPKPKASAPETPQYTGKISLWTSHTINVAQKVKQGDFAGAQDYVQHITGKHPAGNPNAEKFKAYANQAIAHAEANGVKQKDMSARAQATASVEAASAAAAAAKPAPVPVAMPAKPSAAALSSAANPNKTLLAKVDQVEAIVNQHAAGKLSEGAALAALSGITFGSNTYGKKATAYKNDVIAALGGATPQAGAKPTVSQAAAGAAAVAAAASAKAKPKAPKFDASRLTETPDFLNWQGTGKGLSSKPEVNKANQDEVKAIRSMAATGNLAALKAYTPKSPSKHVASYLQQVIEDVNLQLNPPPRLSSIKVGGGMTMDQSIKALAKAAKPLKNPSQILNKLAIYPVLGKTDAPAASAPPQLLKYGAGLTQSTYANQSSANFAKLDSVKQSAVRAYTGSAYHDINSAFRAGSPTKQALDADAGIRQSGVTLKPGTVLSRKVSMSQPMLEQLQKHGTGKILQEFGISSTSISPKVWGGNVHFRMTAGPGVKGLYAGTGSNKPGGGAISNHPGELEMLLPANQRMLVTGVHKGPQADGFGHGSTIVVDVTLLPNE